MTELATRNTGALDTSPAAILAAPASGTVKLAEWAQELTAAHQLGTALCQTDFVPKDFRGKPEAAAAAILAGKALGLDPMNALSNIFVVHGRPALYARTMTALVMNAGHEVIRTNATADSVTVTARRKGSKDWQEFTWSMERARLAGYTSNAKYKSNPIEMLTAKAMAEACRVIAPDVLTGVAAYSVEEVELENLGERPTTGSRLTTPEPPAPAAAPAPATTADRFTQPAAPAPQDEPVDTSTGELPADPSDTVEEDGTEPASAAQIDAVVTALNNAGHKTKAAKQAAIAEALGEQKSATQLTAFEADTLVTYFAEEA